MAAGRPNPKSSKDDSDLMDKDISFEQRDMHKTWPLIKGCMLLGGIAIAFIWFSMYFFKAFRSWFN
jgi:hypothetical protein